ncbi:MAG: TrmH family RNA methyltransferase [Paracoccaceae bacterium]
MAERAKPARRPAGRGAGPRPAGPGRGARSSETVWLFGLHAVADALANPRRRPRRLILTPNARGRVAERLGEAALAGLEVEIETADPRRFAAPLDPGSVHQGAALEAEPLDWGPVEAACPAEDGAVVLALDRVTDPHNVGAVLRSAEVFGAKAVIAPARHSAPETGALAKAASGALERQPYLRPTNLGDALAALAERGYRIVGLDGAAEAPLGAALDATGTAPLALVLGAEGPGMRERTRGLCHALARIEAASDFASLNVSNAAAVALYAACRRRA